MSPSEKSQNENRRSIEVNGLTKIFLERLALPIVVSTVIALSGTLFHLVSTHAQTRIEVERLSEKASLDVKADAALRAKVARLEQIVLDTSRYVRELSKVKDEVNRHVSYSEVHLESIHNSIQKIERWIEKQESNEGK